MNAAERQIELDRQLEMWRDPSFPTSRLKNMRRHAQMTILYNEMIRDESELVHARITLRALDTALGERTAMRAAAQLQSELPVPVKPDRAPHTLANPAGRLAR